MIDKDLIIGMKKQQKEVYIQSQSNLSSQAHIHSLINKIINMIRNKGQPCTIKQIKEINPNLDLNNPDFIAILNTSKKLRFNKEKELFELKSKFNIRGYEDLQTLIKKEENGIPFDEELKDSYIGIEKDIERLKKEGKLRVIYNDEKKIEVLFYRDIMDVFEKYLVNEEFKETVDEIRKVWKDELKLHEGHEKYAPIIKRRDENLLKKKKKKGNLMRSRQSNTHLLDYDK